MADTVIKDQISWIERRLQVSKSVRCLLTPAGLGTGFSITPGLLMTNQHVIPDAEFNYQHDFAGQPMPTCRYNLDKDRFGTNPALNYTIVGVLPDLQKSAISKSLL